MKWISLIAVKGSAPKRALLFKQLENDGVCCLGLPGEKEELTFFSNALDAVLSGGFFPYALTLDFIEDGKRFTLTQEAKKTDLFCDGAHCNEELAERKRAFLYERCVLPADLWLDAFLGGKEAMQALYPMESAERYLHTLKEYAASSSDLQEKAFCRTVLRVAAGENEYGVDFTAYLRTAALGNLAPQASKPLLSLTGGRYYFAARDMEHHGRLVDTHTGKMAEYVSLDTATLFYAAVSAALAGSLKISQPVFPYLLRAKAFEGKISQEDVYRVRSYFYRLAKGTNSD